MIKPLIDDFPVYYRDYVKDVIDKNIIEYFRFQRDQTVDFFGKISEEKSTYRYAGDKWSIREVLGHLCDTERIFANRALQIARNEKQELPGFDENDYVKYANFDEITLAKLTDQFNTLRISDILLFDTFNDKILRRKGFANGAVFTAASIIYIIAGHLDHHVKVIAERYL